MITYDSRVMIDRPPDEVFTYLVEPPKQALWSDVPMRKLTAGPWQTGSKMDVTFGKGPLKATIGLDVTALEAGRRMAWASFSGPVDWMGEYRLAPSGPRGTELRQEGRLVFKGLWRLLEPLVGAEIRSGEIKELERLKAAAEAA
jgi:hypothetical protein